LRQPLSSLLFSPDQQYLPDPLVRIARKGWRCRNVTTEEEQRTATLEWIPRSMRTRMDEASVRISLAQWHAMPLAARHDMAEAAKDTQVPVERFAALLALAIDGTAA